MATAKETCKSVPKSCLDHEVSLIHIAQLAKSVTEWQELAPFLDLLPAEEKEIVEEYRGRIELQGREALRKWKMKNGPTATYQNLINIFCEKAKRADLAEAIKSLLFTLSNNQTTGTDSFSISNDHIAIVSDTHIVQLAKRMTEWQELAPFLDLSPDEEEDIIEKYWGHLNLQTREALRKWKEKNGRMATYQSLIKIFHEQAERPDLADVVKNLLSNNQTTGTDSSGISNDHVAIVSDIHITQLAKRMIEWKEVAPFLDLSSADEEEIVGVYRGHLILQTREALRKWKAKNGPKATYQNLIKIFREKAERADLADVVESLPFTLSDNQTTGTDSSSISNDHIAIVSDIHITQLAKRMTMCQELVPFLDLSPDEERDIIIKVPVELRGREALRKWKAKNGPKATYQNLIKIFHEQAKRADLADVVESLLSESS